MSSSEKKFSRKREKQDESGLSRNHSKSVLFRLRVQQEKEAELEIKEYKDTEEYEQYYNRNTTSDTIERK